jgi:tRNA pseudouridine55 synthase
MKPRSRTVFRRLDGILLLDKPQGLSSNQALQRVRHLLRAEKGGHTGSLDPLATGLLPLCFGEATKIAGLMLGGRKGYVTLARLGTRTDTADADGQALETRPVPVLDADAIEAALDRFRGPIRQRPPVYSALKQGGEPLYRKARRGEAVEVPEREVVIDALEFLGREGKDLHLRVDCSAGTYIRSLVADLGEALGCGAHVAELRRTWAAPFMNPRMWALDEVEAMAGQGDAAVAAALLPIEAGLAGLDAVELDAAHAQRFVQGQSQQLVAAADAAQVAVLHLGRALGLGRIEQGRLLPLRGFRPAETLLPS